VKTRRAAIKRLDVIRFDFPRSRRSRPETIPSRGDIAVKNMPRLSSALGVAVTSAWGKTFCPNPGKQQDMTQSSAKREPSHRLYQREAAVSEKFAMVFDAAS
jgi:hypothetical protein